MQLLAHSHCLPLPPTPLPGNSYLETTNSLSAIGQHHSGSLLQASNCWWALHPTAGRVVVVRQSEVRGESCPSPLGPPARPVLGHQVSWGPSKPSGDCVLLGSRALAKAARWPGPGLDAAVNLPPSLPLQPNSSVSLPGSV